MKYQHWILNLGLLLEIWCIMHKAVPSITLNLSISHCAELKEGAQRSPCDGQSKATVLCASARRGFLRWEQHFYKTADNSWTSRWNSILESCVMLICRGRNWGAVTGKHKILSASEGAFLLGLKQKPTSQSQQQATSSYCFYYKQISLHHTVLFFLLTVQYGHPKILLFVLFFTHTALKQNSVWKKSSFLQHSSTSKLSSNKMAFIHQPRFQTVKWLLLSYGLACFLNTTPEYIASGSSVTSVIISWGRRRRSMHMCGAGDNTWTQCHDHRGRMGQDSPLVLRWKTDRGKLGIWCWCDSFFTCYGSWRGTRPGLPNVKHTWEQLYFKSWASWRHGAAKHAHIFFLHKLWQALHLSLCLCFPVWICDIQMKYKY